MFARLPDHDNDEQAPLPSPTAPVDRLASELWAMLRAEGLNESSRSWTVLERILDHLTDAERELCRQSVRIAELEAMSVTDELTGLYNRRGFNSVLERTLANARRYREHGMLVYVDLDGFKHINDTHGHDAGDQALKAAANIIRQNVRATDYVSRMGGDEFAILYVRADSSGFKRSLERLRAALNTATVVYRGALLPLAASLGVVSYGPGALAEELLMRADRAMYLEKKARAAQSLRQAVRA